MPTIPQEVYECITNECLHNPLAPINVQKVAGPNLLIDEMAHVIGGTLHQVCRLPVYKFGTLCSWRINHDVCSIHSTYTVGKTQSLEVIHRLLKLTLVLDGHGGAVINAHMTVTYDREAYLAGIAQIDCF